MRLNSLPVLVATFLAAMLCGCATKPSRTAQIERRLAASGFQVMPATTPKQLELVSQLDPNSLTLMTRNGKQYYVFPDATQKQLYIGQAAQYQAYQSLIEIEQAQRSELKADQTSLMEARNDSLPEWNNAWGSWTGD
ncbi:MAG: hypothetical protein U1G08_08235 [Verrucomicrobiota bacterium]